MGRNAGFFPLNETALRRYGERMREDMKELTTLASWRPEELMFKNKLKGITKVGIDELFPVRSVYTGEYSWTEYLNGKNVLVIHPFAESIEHQYKENRKRIFSYSHILPEFSSLKTVKAVQSIAGNNPSGFSDWFEALNYMEEKIAAQEFDIALIGCGAYGFPLAATVKRMGKNAVHIGGALQLLFGIKGKRWDNQHLYNEYWVSPMENERPANLAKVEDGCYW